MPANIAKNLIWDQKETLITDKQSEGKATSPERIFVLKIAARNPKY